MNTNNQDYNTRLRNTSNNNRFSEYNKMNKRDNMFLLQLLKVIEV